MCRAFRLRCRVPTFLEESMGFFVLLSTASMWEASMSCFCSISIFGVDIEKEKKQRGREIGAVV